MVKIIEISYNRSFCRLRLDNGEEYWIRDKDLSFTGSKPKIIGSEKVGKNLTVTLTANAFIHGVHIKENLRRFCIRISLKPRLIKE